MNLSVNGSIEQWKSLKDYLKHYCHDYERLVFSPSEDLSPFENFALSNMHTKACFSYVINHLNSEELKRIVVNNGLPTPLLIESEIENLTKQSLLKPKDAQVVFEDQFLFSDWVVNLLVTIEPTMFLNQLTDRQEVIISPQEKVRQIDGLCMTEKECDFVELLLMAHEIPYVRDDGMGLMDDPIINTVKDLFLYLNKRSHTLFLVSVVSQNIVGFHTYSYMEGVANKIAQYAETGLEKEDIPQSLHFIADLCKCYKNGATLDSICTFLTVLCPETASLNKERIEALKESFSQLTQAPILALNLKEPVTSPHA